MKKYLFIGLFFISPLLFAGFRTDILTATDHVNVGNFNMSYQNILVPVCGGIIEELNIQSQDGTVVYTLDKGCQVVITVNGSQVFQANLNGIQTGLGLPIRYQSDSGNIISVTSPSGLGSNYGITWPSTIPSSSGLCLSGTNTDPVVLSWVSCSGGPGPTPTVNYALLENDSTFILTEDGNKMLLQQ